MVQKVVLVVVALALAAIVPVAGQNPNSVSGEIMIGWLATLVPPDTTCIGGEPTGDPYVPCSADTKHVRVRDEVQTWGAIVTGGSESLADLLDGPITFVVNCNLSSDYRGPCFGTFEWTVEGIGKWEGSWTAPLMDLVTFETKMSMVGHGVGGSIEGLQIRFDGATPGDWFIPGTVRIN